MECTTIDPISWDDGTVVILDQTRLPQEELYLRATTIPEVADAICRLAVRGAPLIGIAAAYGIALAARGDKAGRLARVREAAETLRATRPTARNLFWAIDRMVAVAETGASEEELLLEARRVHAEDAQTCRLIGEHGAPLLPHGATVMTVCNAGLLATGGQGTSLGVIRAARAAGNPVTVLACETRPLLQGARLTMWELTRDGIPATLITDSMAATMMRQGKVAAVIAGADRIARNGDTANKIGTYSLAVLAHHHGVPFYVAAPMSTVDLSLHDGSEIPIEERRPEEVSCFAGLPTAPEGAAVMNPAFDVTPADLITAIITERGVHRAPYEEGWGEEAVGREDMNESKPKGGYFGGLGAGKGWHKFYFCITPEEFRAVLESEPLLLVVTNRRTDETDRYVDVARFIDNYRAYAESVARDDTTDWRVTGPMWVSLTHPQCSLHVRPISGRPGEPLGVVQPEEPVVELRALSIYYDGKTLYTNMGDPRDEQRFGMEMDFARVVFAASDGYAIGYDTSDAPNAALFARLTAQIRAITKPCRIESPSRVHRTQIRISPAMREVMRDSRSLARHGLRVL